MTKVPDWNKQAKREKKFQKILDEVNKAGFKEEDGVRWVNYEEVLEVIQKMILK